MISEKLREARQYEEAAEKRIGEFERPVFHLTPRTGWMNDPNGFSCYGGRYHLFYQYYPYEAKWNSMHWGHAVSRDLLTWEYLPAALAPDEDYDGAGCFSGSALTLPDGRQLLMYTGVGMVTDASGRHEVQTQNLAVGDGIDYEKWSGNPVLDGESVPEGGSRIDFRDPKLLQMRDGTYAAIVGNRPADGSGQILLYRSRDGFSWEYGSVLAENRNRFGRMWECPDFFELDGKWLLLVSPQDMLQEGLRYHSGNGTVCLSGTFDEAAGTFLEESDQPIDCGIDFYAPQTLLTPDGRRVMIGWLQNWDACAIRDADAPWAGQMSIPRELHFRDGVLFQQPVRELTERRHDGVCFENVEVSGETRLPGISGRVMDLEVEIAPADPEEVFYSFAIRVAENGNFHTDLIYRPREHTLTIDRRFSGSRRAVIHERSAWVTDVGGHLRLRIILDRYSLEVFVGDGEQVMSAALYTEPAADGVGFICDGASHIHVRKWEL